MPAEEKIIRSLVKTAVECYASGFSDRHLSALDDPDGTINMKIHNVFIAALGPEIQYYTALCRSLDSSLGNMLEKLAVNIAEQSYSVSKNVEGKLFEEQTQIIATLLESYKSHRKTPTVQDYQTLRSNTFRKSAEKRHDSDYYLVDKDTNEHILIELKIGGDLDNKKSRSEKEAVLEQFAILSNNLPQGTPIKIYFATAYNRFGEDKPWNQSRVKQFFADEELLIGKDFWNLICKSSNGYEIVRSTLQASMRQFIKEYRIEEEFRYSARNYQHVWYKVYQIIIGQSYDKG
ncbi:MAG: TdeIII family type II restriction endonuclease [Planctomycetaceae bacterium]|nr:TdeIII family type II restriction endonuclease [Planctomycetaceae bacterium]